MIFLVKIRKWPFFGAQKTYFPRLYEKHFYVRQKKPRIFSHRFFLTRCDISFFSNFDGSSTSYFLLFFVTFWGLYSSDFWHPPWGCFGESFQNRHPPWGCQKSVVNRAQKSSTFSRKLGISSRKLKKYCFFSTERKILVVKTKNASKKNVSYIYIYFLNFTKEVSNKNRVFSLALGFQKHSKAFFVRV